MLVGVEWGKEIFDRVARDDLKDLAMRISGRKATQANGWETASVKGLGQEPAWEVHGNEEPTVVRGN